MSKIESPLPHQVRAIEKMKECYLRGDKDNYFLLFHGMRCRKTTTVLFFIEEFKSLNGGLIICPKIAVPVWEEWVSAFGLTMDVVSESKLRKDIDAPKGKEWAKMDALLKKRYSSVVVDEAHQFRRNSSRSAAVERILKRAKPEFRVALSGTPYDRDAEELFNIVKLMDGGKLLGQSKKKFLHHICYVVNPEADYNAQKWKIRPKFLRPLVKMLNVDLDNTQTSAPKEEGVYYALTDTQKRWIKCIIDEVALLEIDGENTLANDAVKVSKIAQVMSGFYIRRDDSVHRVGLSNKWGKLCEIVEEYERKRVMIFVRFIEEREIIKRLYPEAVDLTTQTLEDFNNDEVGIMIGHPKSCSVGIDISHADCLVFTSMVDSFIDTKQSLFRMSTLAGQEGKRTFVLKAAHNYAVKREAVMDEKRAAYNELFALQKKEML